MWCEAWNYCEDDVVKRVDVKNRMRMNRWNIALSSILFGLALTGCGSKITQEELRGHYTVQGALNANTGTTGYQTSGSQIISFGGSQYKISTSGNLSSGTPGTYTINEEQTLVLNGSYAQSNGTNGQTTNNTTQSSQQLKLKTRNDDGDRKVFEFDNGVTFRQMVYEEFRSAFQGNTGQYNNNNGTSNEQQIRQYFDNPESFVNQTRVNY